MARNRYTKRKQMNLMRFNNLPTSSGQKGEDVIQITEYEGYKLIRRSKLRIYAIRRRILSNKLAIEFFNTIHLSQKKVTHQWGQYPSLYSHRVHEEKKIKNSEFESETYSKTDSDMSRTQNTIDSRRNLSIARDIPCSQ